MNEVLHMINEMSPFLLLGFLMAGVLHAFIPARFYTRYLSRGDFRSVFYAAMMGVPLPLCSCGVLPTAMSLRKEGASKGATTSFLIATPQTGVDSIAATYSLMGAAFAVIRPVAALLTALFGGQLANWMTKSEVQSTKYEVRSGEECCCCHHDEPKEEHCCCHHEEPKEEHCCCHGDEPKEEHCCCCHGDGNVGAEFILPASGDHKAKSEGRTGEECCCHDDEPKEEHCCCCHGDGNVGAEFILPASGDHKAKSEGQSGEEHCCCHGEVQSTKDEVRSGGECCCHGDEPKEEHCCCCHGDGNVGAEFILPASGDHKAKSEVRSTEYEGRSGGEECCCHGDEAEGECCGCHCGEKVAEDASFLDKVKEALRYAFIYMVGDIGKWLVIGLVIAALITVLVPAEFFAVFADNTLLSMALVLAVSVPMYVCATGSIPIAVALMLKGLTPGAALVLLMAGPAANVASILVIRDRMGTRALAAYLLAIVGGAVACGLAIDWLMPREWFVTSLMRGADCCEPTTPFQWCCTAVLAALLLWAAWRRYAPKS